MYKRIPDLKTIVPPLLGLKGNLEMTIASRISTLVLLFIVSTRFY